MTTTNTFQTEIVGNDVIFTRTIDARAKWCFRPGTDPAYLAQWFGPHNFTNPVREVDLRPGGAYRIVMRSPDGTEFPVRGSTRRSRPPSASSSASLMICRKIGRIF